MQAVAVQNRKVVPPSKLLERIGVSGDIVDSLLWKDEEEDDDSADNDGNDAMAFLRRFKDLDVAFRQEAAADDERLLSTRDYSDPSKKVQ